MHELKMHFALFIPVMTSYKLSVWQSVALCSCFDSMLSKPCLNSFNACTRKSEIMAQTMSDSSFPVREWKPFYDWLITVDSNLTLLLCIWCDWPVKTLPPIKACKAPPSAARTLLSAVKTCNILVDSRPYQRKVPLSVCCYRSCL